jgi:hypothetical protein
LVIKKVVLDPIKNLIIRGPKDFEVRRHPFCMLRIYAAADGYTELRAPVSAGYTHYVVKMVSNWL